MLLRNPRPGDGALVIDTILASMPELKLWMPWANDAYTAAAAEDWCRRSTVSSLTREDAGYLIFDRKTSRYLGNISTWSKGWNVPKFEIGYWLATCAVGNGYMTEALIAITEMTFKFPSGVSLKVQNNECRLQNKERNLFSVCIGHSAFPIT